MLDTLAKYVYEVYRSKSVSAAAKKLYISQPALSSSIKKAEKELGAPIFNRKTLPFSLTAEGKAYIDAIEKVMQTERQMHDKIQELSRIDGGNLTIATSTNLSYNIIPKICELFRTKYPHVEISIIVANTSKFGNMLEDKTADIVFLPSEHSAPGYKTVPLFEEKFVIAIRNDYPHISHLTPYAFSYDEIISENYPEDKQIKDMALFKGIEFVYCPPNSNIYSKRRLIMKGLGLSPYIITSSASPLLHYNMMLSGVGAFFTTNADIAVLSPTDKCLFFVLDIPEAVQTFSLAYDENVASPSYKLKKEFVETAKEFFNCSNPLRKIR